MPARIRTRPLEIETDRRTVPLVLDLDRGSALFDWDNRRYSVRPIRWRAKVQLARFAHLGGDFIDDRWLELSLENQPAPDDDELRDVVRTVARWLESAGRTEAPLPLDELELLRSARELSRDTGWTLDEIGELDAGVVERAIERVRSRRSEDSALVSANRTDGDELIEARAPDPGRRATDSASEDATRRSVDPAPPRRPEASAEHSTAARSDARRSLATEPLRPGATRIIVLPDSQRGGGEPAPERSEATAERAEVERSEREQRAPSDFASNDRPTDSPDDGPRPLDRAALPFRVRPHSESGRRRSNSSDAVDPHARSTAMPAGLRDAGESHAALRLDGPRTELAPTPRPPERRESASPTTTDECEPPARAFERSFFPELSSPKERPELSTSSSLDDWIEELTRRLVDTVEDLGLTEER